MYIIALNKHAFLTTTECELYKENWVNLLGHFIWKREKKIRRMKLAHRDRSSFLYRKVFQHIVNSGLSFWTWHSILHCSPINKPFFFTTSWSNAHFLRKLTQRSYFIIASFSFFPSHLYPSLTHTHAHTGRCTKAHTVGTCRFRSTAAWLAGMAYIKHELNCRFLVGVIIQAYMHGREGLDVSPESSLPAFLPATSAGYCCELEILTDSPICF